jgi:alginate O-acetyltransferase complex protein AlgI
MLFSEPAFLFLFLPLLLLVYCCTPQRGRNLVLTVASLAFYALGEWKFIPLMVGSIAINYWIALGLDRVRGTRWARPLLVLGVASDLALLFVFKYANWAADSLNQLLALAQLAPFHLSPILLPLGISFFTFHKISYKVDVYRDEAAVRRNPLDLALYILFFPQLIAGPIVRYHEIADQLVKRTVTRPGFAEGVRRFVIGFGKKMIIANTAAACADPIFVIPASQLTPDVAWLGILCYTIQIYFDFSGYSDMAVGLAHMFGFRFPENFAHPYIAQSVTEFWRRWHMSLSRWFRDYLYIPLGGNRFGPARTYFNLVTVFFLCGLWHGAASTFVVWGIYHGAFLVVERLGLGRWLEARPRLLRHVYTLLVVMIGWVFFRAETLDRAVAFLATMAGLRPASGVTYDLAFFLNPWLVTVLVCGVIGSMPLGPALARVRDAVRARQKGSAGWAFDTAAEAAGLAGLAVTFLLSLMLMAAGTYNPFIYFRF